MWDEDGTYDALVDYSYSNFYYPTKNYNHYNYMYGRSGGTNVYLYVRHKWYCPSNYYDTYCTRYCVYTDDSTGHYTCDGNGYPICLNGWTGTSTYCVTGQQHLKFTTSVEQNCSLTLQQSVAKAAMKTMAAVPSPILASM